MIEIPSHTHTHTYITTRHITEFPWPDCRSTTYNFIFYLFCIFAYLFPSSHTNPLTTLWNSSLVLTAHGAQLGLQVSRNIPLSTPPSTVIYTIIYYNIIGPPPHGHLLILLLKSYSSYNDNTAVALLLYITIYYTINRIRSTYAQ